MTLILNLTPKLKLYLAQEAEQQGLSVEEYALQVLTKYILVKERKTKAIELLQSWLDEDDAEEQQETGEYLIDTLDKDRIGDHQLFPANLKGVTW